MLVTAEMKLDVSPALKRAIQQRIENPVSKLILQGRFGPKDVIPVGVGSS
ncbi:MAG: hypothetical protein HUU30_17225 [Burkholderiaceae bacterium]|nr:hypothetical protein [Burkholderiaceae bacterium]